MFFQAVNHELGSNPSIDVYFLLAYIYQLGKKRIEPIGARLIGDVSSYEIFGQKLGDLIESRLILEMAFILKIQEVEQALICRRGTYALEVNKNRFSLFCQLGVLRVDKFLIQD